MKIDSVFDDAFRPYGQVLSGYDWTELTAAMKEIPLPAVGTAYEPSIDSLERCSVFSQLRDHAYGGQPVQLGMCWGHNRKLNCLEYHRDSEINIGTEDFILLLARRDEIADGALDTTKVKAFRVPACTAIEVYATTLHFAPCHVEEQEGFRVAVVLPEGTNTEMPKIEPSCEEDRWLWARNKWLLAHPDTEQAAKGAHVGLHGENIDISASL